MLSYLVPTLFLLGIIFSSQQGPQTVQGLPHQEWSPAQVSYYRTRSLRSGNLNVRVTTFGQTHDLELFRAANIFSPYLEEYVSKVDDDGYEVIQKLVTTRSEQDDLESKLYTNADGSASLFVQERDGLLALEGILSNDIHISEDSRSLRSNDALIRHIAYRRENSRSLDCRAVVLNETFQVPPMQEIAAEKRELPTVITPEVFFVIEYGFSAYFQHNLNAIKQYIAIFFNSVNRRYDMITTPKIQNVICGILQVTNPNTETFKTVGTGNILDAAKTLDAFGKWMFDQNRNGAIKTQYDVGIWITSLDLGSLSGSTYSSSTAGIAYIGSACTSGSDRYYKVGLAEDKPGFYSGILNHAHELAHLYGAAHDGDNVNYPTGNPGAASCPWSEGHIMSYNFGTPDKMNFSSCSVNQFKFVMGSSQGSCLIDAPRANVVVFNSTLPGRLVDLDTQCKSSFGNDYYFYMPYINEVCVKRWCARKISSVSLSLSTNGPALEGSFCDVAKTKVCINGLCSIKK